MRLDVRFVDRDGEDNVLIGAGAIFFLRTDLTDALNPVAEAMSRRTKGRKPDGPSSRNSR